MPNQFDEAVVGWAVKDDQDLRLHVRKLAWAMLDEAYRILETGRPQDRMALIQRLVPPMMRALGEEDQTGRGIDELRAEHRQVLKEIRESPSPATATVDPGQELQRGPVHAELGTRGLPEGVREAVR